MFDRYKMPGMTTFHEKLRLAADVRGISQADIRRGLETPVAPATLSNWFNGYFIPPADIAFKLARFVGVPLDMLMDPAVDLEAVRRHLAGEEGLDPAQRAILHMANRHGWDVLLDRVTRLDAPGRQVTATDPGATGTTGDEVRTKKDSPANHRVKPDGPREVGRPKRSARRPAG